MPAGRKLGFVPEEVVMSAMRVFWERGYTATTKTEIEAATGIARSSLANTFGSKEELFSRCVDAFLDLLLNAVDELLVNGQAGLDDLAQYFDQVAASATSSGSPSGCLMVKTMMNSTECPPSAEQIERYRTGLLGGFQAALARGVALDGVDAGSVDQRAELLYMWFCAINMTADTVVAPVEVPVMLEAVRSAISAWSGEGASP